MDWKWIAGGAILTGLASIWGYVRWCFTYLSSLLIINYKLDISLVLACATYLNREATRYRYGPRSYGALQCVMKRDGRYSLQVYEEVTRGALFWVGRVPVWIGGGRIDEHSPGGAYCIISIRGLLNVERLLCGAAVYQNEFDQRSSDLVRRFRSTTLSGRGAARLAASLNGPAGDPMHTVGGGGVTSLNSSVRMVSCNYQDIGVDQDSFVTLDTMSLGPDALHFVRLAESWLNSRAWYRARSIPWRLGANLIGPPGTGKTSFVRAVAQRLDMPVFTFDLASMDNIEFRDAWRTVRGESPAVVLLEDIDSVFDGREPVNPDSGLTFDAILQALSGVDEAGGVLTFVTTNRELALDSALTRPGRAEYRIEMGGLDRDGVRKIVSRILFDWPDAVEQVTERSTGRTGAEVQLACLEYAAQRKVVDRMVITT